MTREEVIQGLQFTIEMFLFDPSTGETLTEPRNNLDKATIDACKGAIELLKQQPCEDCISRQALIEKATSWNKHFADSERYVSLTDIQNAPSVTSKAEWIPIKIRPMTEEEKEHFFEYADSRYDDTYTILDCPLPDDGQEVILSVNGYVCTDIFCRDSADGCYFETYDIDDVEAWMPLPQPYKVESEDAK